MEALGGLEKDKGPRKKEGEKKNNPNP